MQSSLEVYALEGGQTLDQRCLPEYMQRPQRLLEDWDLDVVVQQEKQRRSCAKERPQRRLNLGIYIRDYI